MRDLHNNIGVVPALTPRRILDNTVQLGNIIDLQGFNACEFALISGNIGDSNATFTPEITEGDEPDGSGMTPVGQYALVGTQKAASFAYTLASNASNLTRKIGYVGAARYVRLTVTPSNNSGEAYLAAVCMLGYPNRGAVGNPSDPGTPSS